jgi:hypothetical protein
LNFLAVPSAEGDKSWSAQRMPLAQGAKSHEMSVATNFALLLGGAGPTCGPNVGYRQILLQKSVEIGLEA